METQATSRDADSDAPVAKPAYVGFWIRFLAFLVDSIWAMVVVALVAAVILGQPDIDMETVAADPAGALVMLSGRILLDVIVVAIIVLGFWIVRSATPGKMVFSAVIADAKTLGEPSKLQLVGRYLGYFVSIFGLMLGFLWIAFDPRKQGWHDKLAGTLVIKRPKRK